MCVCGEYEDPVVTGRCRSCAGLCQNASDDCGRFCPCYKLMQEQYKNMTDLLTQNDSLKTQNEVLLTWVILLACSIFLLVVGCVAYWRYRKYCRDAREARECKGPVDAVQSEGNGRSEQVVIDKLSADTGTPDDVQANGTPGQDDEVTLEKTSYSVEDESHPTEDTPMTP
ncbi:hypothetical protein LSAT2_002063 [Lamellibrachia satsuma]|nr:hypothetical protein LSAT2_002063 [Lamellibrachia satsuma]